MNKYVVAFIAGFMAIAVTAPFGRAAGPFDGKWVGTAPDAGECGPMAVTLVVNGTKITGSVSGKRGTSEISAGTLAADGSGQVKYAPLQRAKGSVHFSGAQFTGSFESYCGVRNVTGARAP